MQHKGVIELKPSNFQLINKPRITKSIFQVNKDYNFSTEVLLEIDKNTKVSETFGEEMAAIVVLSLEFFQGKYFKEIPFKLEMEIEGIFKWDEELEDNPSQLEVLLKENAPAILYSYLRPIITSMSIEANLPPLVIPLMNFRERN